MSEELTAFHIIGTWDLVPLPPGKFSIRCRWIYKITTLSKETIECFKTCFVAQDFHSGVIDYEKMFASVAKMTFVRILIALAIAYG